MTYWLNDCHSTVWYLQMATTISAVQSEASCRCSTESLASIKFVDTTKFENTQHKGKKESHDPPRKSEQLWVFCQRATDMLIIKDTFIHNNLPTLFKYWDPYDHTMAVYGRQDTGKIRLTTGHILAMVSKAPNVCWYGRWYPYYGTVHTVYTVYSWHP